nr:hypothetical protein RVX_0158 [Nitratidesulfovibrio sp. HK-II]
MGRMKHTIRPFVRTLLLSGTALLSLALPCAALAWDGFDTESGHLVEVDVDTVPMRGEMVDVYDCDTKETATLMVDAVKNNARTVEITVRESDTGRTRILVMEAR